ncbi:MAG: hypothetical protein IIY94_06850 [Oscillospiraceae bacterium]|nr:hypothetical protein [Oscillospiraceae bacterium]
MKQLDRQAAAYCRRIGRELPFGGQRKWDYLQSLQDDVGRYLSAHPWAKPEELAETFGTPEQIAVAFLSEMDDKEIYRRISARKRVVRLVILGLGLAIGMLAAALLYMILRNKYDMEGHFIITQACGWFRGRIGL